LVNITVDSVRKYNAIKHIKETGNFEEYILPTWKIGKDGFPSKINIQRIYDVCRDVDPDLIHVWGVENYFCNLVKYHLTKQP
jgi:hypothetical protein